MSILSIIGIYLAAGLAVVLIFGNSCRMGSTEFVEYFKREK